MNKKRFLPVGKLKCWLEVNGFRRLLTAVTRRQRRRKKLGHFLALRSVSSENRHWSLQFSLRLGFQDVTLTKKLQQATSDISEVWALTARPELTYEIEVEDEDEDEDEGEGEGEENLRISSYRLGVACPFGWILDQSWGNCAGWENCVTSNDLARALHDLVMRSMGEATSPPPSD